MDEFSTARPQHLRNEGGGGWTIAAVLVVLLLIVAIIGLGSTGGAPPADATSTATGEAASQPAPVATE